MTVTLLGLDRTPDPQVLDLVSGLASARLARDARPDPATARRLLAEHGLWTLGAAEHAGGGGADTVTTVHALAALASVWPGIALACAHAHAAVCGIAAAPAAGVDLADVHEQGRPVAVIDAVDGRVETRTQPGGAWVAVPRIDVTGEADLVVAFADDVAIIPAAEASFSAPLATTGLNGACTMSVAAWVEPRHRAGGPATSAAVRAELHRGIAAVAAGIAAVAASYARHYAGERIQFGAPLTAIPSVREALAEQEDAALTALLHATAAVGSPHRLIATQRAVQAAVDAAALGVQVLGGYGYVADHPVEEYLRDAVSLRAAADTSWGRAGAVRTWTSSTPRDS